MKNYYLFLFKTFLFITLFTSIFSIKINAQEGSCSTAYYEPDLEQEKLLSNLDAQGPFYVKIYPHVIRRDDGSGGQPFSGVIEALSYLNSDYESQNIFFVWDGCINFIDSTSFFNFPNSGLFEIDPHEDGIDVYLLDDLSLIHI